MAPDVLIAELEARSVASLVLPSRQDTQQQGAGGWCCMLIPIHVDQFLRLK
jgi:hypothetical protein